jgi:NNP family nitrate/nitrite transporter-like MFS transporter
VGAVAAGFLMKGLGDTQQTLSILGFVVAATALCALAARFSSSTIEESVIANKLAA